MAVTMDGIYVNGQKVTFHPEDILSGDASAYTEEIGTAVEAWMEENVTGGEQVTDTTLTLPGVPADAEKAGDEIAGVKEDLNSVSDILDISESYEELTPSDASSGGFSGEIGEQITFNTTSQWKRIGFVPEVGKKYKITFYNRTEISARSYVYAVDADGVILSQYADMPAQQSEITQYEYVLSFGAAVSKVWALGKTGSSYPLKAYNVVVSTVVDDLREEIAEVDAKITPAKSPYDKGPFCTNKGDFIGYYTGKNDAYADKDTLGSSTTYAEIIALYDALMAMDTSHITKTALGTASGLDANENAYTLYEYAFAPYAFQSALLQTDATVEKLPIVLCDACIHGFEKNSAFGLYYFLYDLVNNYHNDPVLMAIRSNVVIKVIPVVNPYGFDNGIYFNGNNVNVNRNFYASDWSASETDHTGAEPFDQPESVIVRDWIIANKDDLLAYFNGHTNGMYHVTAYGDANSLMPKFGRTNGDKYFNRIANIIQRHIQAQSSRFYDMYNLSLGSNFLGKYQAETGSVGTAAVWAAEQAQIPSMTFEVCNGIKSAGETVIGLYSAESKKLCSEMFGNIIAQTVYEYSDD